MTRGEIQALIIADEHYPFDDPAIKYKKLGEEVAELGVAIGSGKKEDVLDEIGDVAYVLSHILSKYSSQGIIQAIVKASEKLEHRINTGYYE